MQSGLFLPILCVIVVPVCMGTMRTETTCSYSKLQLHAQSPLLLISHNHLMRSGRDTSISYPEIKWLSEVHAVSEREHEWQLTALGSHR